MVDFGLSETLHARLVVPMWRGCPVRVISDSSKSQPSSLVESTELDTMKKTLLLCFIHGFKGDDDTFEKFPSVSQVSPTPISFQAGQND